MLLPFTLTIDSLTADLLVTTVRGRESINQPYRFEVQAVCADSVDQEAMLGERARLILNVGKEARRVHGIVTACEVSSRRSDDRTVLRLRIEPTLAALKHRSNWRIFHDESVFQVVTKLLTPFGIPFDWRVLRDPERKPHRSQRGERDLAFLHRMLAEEGICYWFEQPEAGESVVFADQASRYSQVVGVDSLRHVGLGDATAADEASILGLQRNARLRPRRQSVRLYDWNRPTHAPLSYEGGLAPAAPDTRALLSIHEFEHSTEGLRANPAPAPMRLEESRQNASVATGTTLYAHVAPGHTVGVTDHSEPTFNRRYVVASVEHHGQAAQSGDLQPRSYEAAITLQPSDVLILAARAKEHVARGLETATVMGPVAEEIHTDDTGRIQLRFHWDAETPGHPAVTAWVRVAQSWGGAGYGATFTPRVGNEVLVGYIDGDPDRPVVVGSLHNALNSAAPKFPHERTRNGIATRSSPDAGSGHLLMFEDKVGEELLEMRSSKTLAVTSVADTVQTAGGRHEVNVASDQTEKVGANQSSAVTGSARFSYGGERRAAISQNDTLHVGGSSERIVGGSVMDVVNGNVVTLIKGTRHSMVGASPGLVCDETVSVSGRYALGAAKGVRLQSPTEIELMVGASRISIRPDRVLIESPLIQLQASDAIKLVQGKDESVASTLVLQGGASLSGGTATVSSGQGAVLVLDAEAKLDGALVKLNCGPGSGGGAEKIGEKAAKGPATFRVLPDGLPPGTTSVTLVVATPSGETLERECVVGGTVTFEGHPGETFTLLEMKVGATTVAYAEVKRKTESESNG